MLSGASGHHWPAAGACGRSCVWWAGSRWGCLMRIGHALCCPLNDSDAGIHVGTQAASSGHGQPPMPRNCFLQAAAWDGRWDGVGGQGHVAHLRAVAAVRANWLPTPCAPPPRSSAVQGCWQAGLVPTLLALACSFLALTCIHPPSTAQPGRWHAHERLAAALAFRGGTPQFWPQAVCHSCTVSCGGGALAGHREGVVPSRGKAGAVGLLLSPQSHPASYGPLVVIP